MTLAQCPVGGIIHDQEGGIIHYVEVEDAHDMGVFEMGDGAGLLLETLHFVGGCESGVEDFDGGMGAETDMLTEVDFGETASSQEADEAIVAEPLADAILHK